MRTRLSPAAEADLRDIWAFGALHWGADQADAYLDRLAARLLWLGGNSGLWRPRPELAPGLFCYPQESHLVFFRRSGRDLLEIVRILHRRMDVERHL